MHGSTFVGNGKQALADLREIAARFGVYDATVSRRLKRIEERGVLLQI
jgi:DNA-binding Lrp family transcriptional regulator